jgi:serine/threonine protein kinase
MKRQVLFNKPGDDSFVNKGLKDLIRGMLKFKPVDRLSIKDIVAHEFYYTGSSRYQRQKTVVAKPKL